MTGPQYGAMLWALTIGRSMALEGIAKLVKLVEL